MGPAPFARQERTLEVRAEHEFSLVRELDVEGVVRALGLERVGDQLVLLFEQVPGVVDAAKAAGIACQGHTVEALHPWEAIIDHAKRSECDLLVMASHGRRGVTALLLGSETQKVLTHSTVAVLVVR